MFWLYLLLRPRHHRVTIRRVNWKHPRFHSKWYWLTGFAFYEVMFWLALAELVTYTMIMWWLLYGAADGVLVIAERRGPVDPKWEARVQAIRPPFPKFAPRAAVQPAR